EKVKEFCGPAGVLVSNSKFENARLHSGGHAGAFAALAAPMWPSVASPTDERALTALAAPLWPSVASPVDARACAAPGAPPWPLVASPVAKVKSRWRRGIAALGCGRWGLGRPTSLHQWLQRGPLKCQAPSFLSWLWSWAFIVLMALVLRDGGAWETGLTLPRRPKHRTSPRCHQVQRRRTQLFKRQWKARARQRQKQRRRKKDTMFRVFSQQGLNFSSFGFGGAGCLARNLRSSELADHGHQENLFGQPPGMTGSRTKVSDIQRASLVRSDGLLTSTPRTAHAPRGGGRDEGAFLKALQQLVEKFAEGQPAAAKGKGKQVQSSGSEGQVRGQGSGKPAPAGGAGKAGKAKGKGEGRPSSNSVDEKQLLAAIARLVGRASEQGPSGLCDRLCSVIESAKAKADASAAKQSFYASWAPRIKAAGEGKAQDQVGWLVDRSVQAITAGEARRRMQEQIPLQAERILVKNPDQATVLMDMARVNEVK
ncbi:unnamed protein product, partial [Symbiodinium sp. CCMP2456]